MAPFFVPIIGLVQGRQNAPVQWCGRPDAPALQVVPQKGAVPGAPTHGADRADGAQVFEPSDGRATARVRHHLSVHQWLISSRSVCQPW